MAKILGGDASKDAKEAAAKARQEQAVANDRQLAQLQSADQKSGASRRNPRGRRLFVSDPANKTSLA